MSYDLLRFSPCSGDLSQRDARFSARRATRPSSEATVARACAERASRTPPKTKQPSKSKLHLLAEAPLLVSSRFTATAFYPSRKEGQKGSLSALEIFTKSTSPFSGFSEKGPFLPFGKHAPRQTGFPTKVTTQRCSTGFHLRPWAKNPRGTTQTKTGFPILRVFKKPLRQNIIYRQTKGLPKKKKAPPLLAACAPRPIRNAASSVCTAGW